MKAGKSKEKRLTKGNRKSSICAEEFVFVNLENDLSDRPKTVTQLSAEFGISRKTFYKLSQKYAPDLAQARAQVQQQIYRDAVRMLRKRLRGKFDLAVMAFAFGVSGVSFAQPASQAGGITQNFYNMEIGELERYVHSRLQETRRKNSQKPGRTN